MNIKKEDWKGKEKTIFLETNLRVRQIVWSKLRLQSLEKNEKIRVGDDLKGQGSVGSLKMADPVT